VCCSLTCVTFHRPSVRGAEARATAAVDEQAVALATRDFDVCLSSRWRGKADVMWGSGDALTRSPVVSLHGWPFPCRPPKLRWLRRGRSWSGHAQRDSPTSSKISDALHRPAEEGRREKGAFPKG